MLDTKARTDLPAIDDDLLRQFVGQCDSLLFTVANGPLSMRTYVKTIAAGDAFSCSCLDRLPRASYEDFQDALVRAGLELHGDYIAGQSVMIVRAAPKGTK